jgi:dihydropteroate synthase
LLTRQRYINAGGKLIDLDTPRVMGILNITPDSFYKGSRFSTEEEVLAAAGKMIADGADMIDIGGYSSRPGADDVSEEEERRRVVGAIKTVSREFPDTIISVDTFRSDVALGAILEAGAHIINDISAGNADRKMAGVVKRLNVPYIIMHMQGTPATMQKNPVYNDIVADLLRFFGEKIHELRQLGIMDIIIDPGFGFGKTIAHNFDLLNRLEDLSITGLPLMAGLSRKSMIWKTLGITPDEALNGTSVLNTIALLKGADILRVHDVKEASEAVRLFRKMKK